MRFDAFISYCHDDVRIAKALQDGLHRLTRRWDSISKIRVFRDATNLHIEALTPAIEKALGESKFLIVLASPQSAAREWVKNEIRLFLATHPTTKVLLVKTGGILEWEKDQLRFKNDATSAFPQVQELQFKQEPLYLDLEWAINESNLTLSNPKFLESVATLAATLQGISKTIIVGDFVDDHRRLKRNQQINLGLRGAFGFGVPASILFALIAAYSFTSNAVLSSSVSAQLSLLIGFLAIGAIGAVTCGTGWRGMLGFGGGFLILLPFYILGSFTPYDSSVKDYIALSAITLAGFVVAGSIGTAMCRQLRAFDGAIAFGASGIVVVALWGVFGGLRPEGIHTELVTEPWFLKRLWLSSYRIYDFAGSIFWEEDSEIILPLIGGMIVGGLLLGVRLANERMAMKSTKKNPMTQRKLKNIRVRSLAGIIAMILIVGLVVRSFIFGDSYQIMQASASISTDKLRAYLSRSTFSADSLGVLLRIRNAFERYGNLAEAESISKLIRSSIIEFSRSPNEFHDRFGKFGPTETLAEVANVVSQWGRPAELELMITHVHESVREGDSIATASVARVENTYGYIEKADQSLASAAAMVQNADWQEKYARSVLAQAYYERGDVENAKRQLLLITNDINTAVAQNSSALIELYDDLLPESGEAFWATGIWEELPEWRTSLGDVMPNVIATIARYGKKDTAVAIIIDNHGKTSLWHKEAYLARNAAQTRQYDTAFAILDAFWPDGEPGLNDFEDRAEGLSEIIKAAIADENDSVLHRALSELRVVESKARQHSELSQFADTIAIAYAFAGDYSSAFSVAKDVSEDHWGVYTAIGRILSAYGKKQEAASTLAKAWYQLQSDWYHSENHKDLANIGVAFAKMGELRSARAVANDIGSDFDHYSDDQKQFSKLSIYTAILEYAAER